MYIYSLIFLNETIYIDVFQATDKDPDDKPNITLAGGNGQFKLQNQRYRVFDIIIICSTVCVLV